MACASTVAVVVPSPAVSDVLLATSRTICAPMFSSGSLRSISLAIVTPSLVMVGAPNFLSRTTLRPLGPSVTLTASASASTPRFSSRRASSLNSSCLAIQSPPVLLAVDLRQNVFLTENEHVFVVDSDLCACILREQYRVARLDVHRLEL